jgi:hypothetical protein
MTSETGEILCNTNASGNVRLADMDRRMAVASVGNVMQGLPDPVSNFNPTHFSSKIRCFNFVCPCGLNGVFPAELIP